MSTHEDSTTTPFEQAQRLSIEVSRREALTTAAKLGLGGAALAAALSGGGDLTQALAATRDSKLSASYNFVFVNHVTTNQFFVPTKNGAQDACDLLGSKYQWTGSATSSVSEMVRAVQNAINGNADGIAVALIDTQAFNAPISQAISKGIPVVAYNADVANKRMAYIGQPLYQSGQTMGKRIAANVKPGSKIVLFIATPGSLNIQPRIDGAKSVLGNKYQVEISATGAAVPGEQPAVESYYKGHQDVKGMFAVDGGSTAGVAITSKKYGLAKKGVYTGGFDLFPETIAGINSGDMGFTLDQQPYLQGFYPVMQLFLYKNSGGLMFPCDTNTSLKIVDKTNVKPYLGKSRFLGTA